MEAVEHLIISIIISPALVFLTFPSLGNTMFLLLSIYGVMAGVLIDLDHFIIARWNNGDWRVLHDALGNPIAAWSNWRDIIDPIEDVPADVRLLVHLLVASLVSTAGYLIDYRLFFITAAMMLIHIMCDIYADLRNGQYVRYFPLVS